MILTTGGRASGATSTRSRPRSFAAAIASSIVNTPSWSPLSAITRTGLIRICRLTRVRGALLLSMGGSCAISFTEVKKADPDYPKIRNSSPTGEVSRTLTHSQREAWGWGSQPTYHIVDTKLAEHSRLDKSKPLVFPRQATGHDLRVVLEHQQPPLRLGPLVDPPPCLEGHEGLQVVAHDPGQRQMRRCRDEIGDEAGLLPAAPDEDRLVIRDMSRRRQRVDPRQDLGFAVDQLKRHALEVVGEIAARGALIGVPREGELVLLHHVAGLGKCQAHLPRGIDPVIAAGVVKMQMGIDHPANIVRSMAQLAQRIFQLGSSILASVVNTVDADELLVLFVADPGIDQDEPIVVLDEQATQRERNAIPLIGLSSARPEHLGNDTEHGAAVEVLATGFEGMAGEATDPKGC